MKLFSSRQARELDRQAAAEYKIPSLLLMEHAGLDTARTVREMLGTVKGKNVLVACGPGNNGGDGLVCARILHDWGARVGIHRLEGEKEPGPDVTTNLEIIKKLIPRNFLDGKAFSQAILAADCVVDALFGTGLTRPVDSQAAAVIRVINESRKPVVSMDLPSGICADTGKVLGSAVQASVTVTLAVPKTGLFLYPGREAAGKLKITYLPIPSTVLQNSPFAAGVAFSRDVASWLPAWKPDIHKGDRGRVMILGGSRGLSGAPALASLAALHAGSGLVYLGIPDGIRALMEHKLTEIIKVGIPQSNNWVFGKPSLPETKAWFEKIDALAVGPGIGRAEETREYARTVIQEYKGPLVIDADGLFALDEEFLKALGRPSLVLTPHEGEMARLCNLPAEEIRENRWEIARQKAKEWNVTLVLKGASTLIVSGNSVWINATGNPGMAVAGSGDVLTGIIVSLLGQGLDAAKAAAAGAYLHGLAGNILAKEIGMRGITAERLSTSLFKAFHICLKAAAAPAAKGLPL